MIAVCRMGCRSGVAILWLFGDIRHSHGDVKPTDGEDDGAERGIDCKVHGRKDSLGSSLRSWADCSAELHRVLQRKLLTMPCRRFGVEEVFQNAQLAMASCWEMTWNQVAEGELMIASQQFLGLSKKLPAVELALLEHAVDTVLDNRLLRGDLGKQLHRESVEDDLGGRNDVYPQTTREQGTG